MPTEANVENTETENLVTPAITVYNATFTVKTKNIEHLRSVKQLLESLKKEGLEYEQC